MPAASRWWPLQRRRHPFRTQRTETLRPRVGQVHPPRLYTRLPFPKRPRAKETAMKDVAVVSYCRTGIAKAQRGALNQTHGIAMTSHVLRHAVKRAGIDAAEVEDVVVGCGLPEGATGHNVARNAALEAGLGEAVPGMTVNRY